MKKHLILFAILFLPLCAFAEEVKTFYDNLPEGIRQVLTAEYDGWSVPDGALLYEDHRAALLVLSKGEKNVAVIMEQRGERFEVAASNDAIIPDRIAIDGAWWIQDKWGTGEPYIWYLPENKTQGFYLDLRRDGTQWMVVRGNFGSDSFGPDTLIVELANQGTAMRVCGENYFSPVYVSADVDLSFENFDRDIVKAFCAQALTLKNKPGLVPSTLEPDAFPQGEVVAFKKGKNYPVYAGPGEEYERLGEQRNASVSTNGWIQVFGREGDWLLIQYNLADGRNRFGYITASALPKGVEVPELNFERKAGVLDSWITDDPLRVSSEVGFPAGTECLRLATFGDEWLYVEVIDPGKPKYRGFASVNGVDLREDHAGKAVIRVESAPLYADALAEDPIGMYFGGVELEVLQTQGGRTQVRIGGETAYQEGWVDTAALIPDAVPSDVPFALAEAVILPSENEPLVKAYAGPSETARRIPESDSRTFSILGEVGGFTQLNYAYFPGFRTFFVPNDWVVPIPQSYLTRRDAVSVVLAEDSPVYTRPDSGAASRIALYKGVTVQCYPMGDWYFVADYTIVPSGLFVATFGYLPASACRAADGEAHSFQVGMLTPANQGDQRWLYVSMNGNSDGIYGWGTRFLLLGETASRYFVRSPLGRYGYLDKADVTLTPERAGQEDFPSLLYGTTLLAQSTGLYQKPFAPAGAYGAHAPRTEVKLLGCLGDWWNVSIGDQTGFLPASALTDLPDAPAYEGIYNDFRDLAFYFLWYTEPPMAFTDTEAWLLLRADDRPVLSHMERHGGAWVETERTGGLLGADVRVISEWDFDLQASPVRFTLACYLTDSNVELRSTFERAADGWKLCRFAMKETEYSEDWGEQTLYDRAFIPAEGGIIVLEDGRERMVALTQPLALDLAQYAVKDMARICTEIMK
ncbi:MAG TPA: hypothetical protein PKE04_08650 [Clostridia bacterium]|nr:hypothetical protein [Clostridia bacterium]